MPPLHVVIDLVPMAAGRGGTGSGIWTYAANLLRQLDDCCPEYLSIGVLLRREQLAELGFKFLRLHAVIVAWPGKGISSRLLWVHLGLPWFCWRGKVRALHKLATDTPLWCSAQRITTLHDFYYEFLLEHTPHTQLRLYERLEQAYFGFVTRLCFRRSQTILAVSEAVRDEAVQRYPAAAKRIMVITHGAPAKYAAAQCETAPDALFRFVYVAKFMAHKGQLEAIGAFERFAEMYPALVKRVRLRFRGFSNDRDYYRRLCVAIERSPLAAQIELVEYQSSDGIQTIYQGASAALLLSQYEGFGFPVVEAHSQGLPLICSDLPVLREVAGASALFVRPDDSTAVAVAMARLLEDASCVTSLRAQGWANLKRFTWEKTACKTLAAYQAVLAAIDGHSK